MVTIVTTLLVCYYLCHYDPLQSPGAAAGTTVDTLPHITAQMQQLQIAAATGYPNSHPVAAAAAAASQQQFHLPTHAQYHGNLPTAAGAQVTHPQWAIAQVSISPISC